MNNSLKTVLFLGILSLLVISIGGLIGGQSGLYIAFFFALLIDGVGYFYSDKISLAGSGAKPLSRSAAPQIYKIVEEITGRMSLPIPRLFITPEPQANAFATGRDPKHASVAVTQGLLKLLSPEEIKGVLAHELSHVKNKDILITSIAAVLASSVSFISNMGYYGGFGFSRTRNRDGNGGLGFLLIILAPIVAVFLQLAISREREYEADRSGAAILGTGEPLADALTQIGQSAKLLPMRKLNPALSSLYIANPLREFDNAVINLLSTHPPLIERIRRLRNMNL